MTRLRYIFLEDRVWNPISTFISSNFRGVNSPARLRDYILGISRVTNLSEIRDSTAEISKRVEKTFLGANQVSVSRFFSKSFGVLSEGLLKLKNHLAHNELPVHIITQRTNVIQLFTREFIVLILFAAFLGLFPEKIFNRNTPGLNFDNFFSDSNQSKQQLSCFLDYFNILAERISLKDPIVSDYVIFERHYQILSGESFFTSSMNPIPKVKIIREFMEEYNPGGHVIEAIFGNKRIGSATLDNVMNQEEIMMTLATETLIARIFHSDLHDEEVLSFRGLMKFSSYRGFGSSRFTYLPASEEDKVRSVSRIYASIDAICDQSKPRQFTSNYSLRELNKLVPVLCKDFYGESENPYRSPFVTGYWGSGVFGGDLKYKFIIQLIASCVCGRQLVYSDAQNQLNQAEISKIESKYGTCGNLARAFFQLERSGALGKDNTLRKLLS